MQTKGPAPIPPTPSPSHNIVGRTRRATVLSGAEGASHPLQAQSQDPTDPKQGELSLGPVHLGAPFLLPHSQDRLGESRPRLRANPNHG